MLQIQCIPTPVMWVETPAGSTKVEVIGGEGGDVVGGEGGDVVGGEGGEGA